MPGVTALFSVGVSGCISAVHYDSDGGGRPSQAKPLLATDPRHAGHAVPSGRAPAFRPGGALRMQRCAWQNRPTPAALPVAQAGRGSVWVRLRARTLPRPISRAMRAI